MTRSLDVTFHADSDDVVPKSASGRSAPALTFRYDISPKPVSGPPTKHWRMPGLLPHCRRPVRNRTNSSEGWESQRLPPATSVFYRIS